MAQLRLDLPTLQQSLPLLQGVTSGQDMVRAYLQNQAQRQKNVAQPDLDAATLANLLARTEGRKLTTEQMPERLGLDEYRASVAAQNAARGLQNIDLQNRKMGAYYANAMSRFSRSQPGQISQGMDPRAAAGALAGAGGFSQQFGQEFGAPGAGSQRPPPQMPVPNFPALQQYLGQAQQPGAPPVAQNVPPAMQGQPQAQPQPQQPMQPQAQPQPPEVQLQPQQGGVPDEMIKALQDAQQSASIKATTTAQIINQRHYSDLLDDLIERTTPNMLTAIKAYSGSGGTARLKRDQLASLAPGGKVTPELMAFNRVKNVATQFLANEVTRSLGEAHNIATADEMRKLANPIYWGTNPQLALAQWDEFVKNSKQVSKTLSKSTAQTLASLRATSVEGPQAQPSVVSSAPSGTVEMIDQQGRRRAVPADQANDAINYGWRRAGG